MNLKKNVKQTKKRQANYGQKNYKNTNHYPHFKRLFCSFFFCSEGMVNLKKNVKQTKKKDKQIMGKKTIKIPSIIHISNDFFVHFFLR